MAKNKQNNNKEKEPKKRTTESEITETQEELLEELPVEETIEESQDSEVVESQEEALEEILIKETTQKPQDSEPVKEEKKNEPARLVRDDKKGLTIHEWLKKHNPPRVNWNGFIAYCKPMEEAKYTEESIKAMWDERAKRPGGGL